MNISDYKRDMLDHLKEILKAEGKAGGMYMEIARDVKNAQLKSFFMNLAEEEKYHAKLVNDMIMLLEGSTEESWHEPPPA